MIFAVAIVVGSVSIAHSSSSKKTLLYIVGPENCPYVCITSVEDGKPKTQAEFANPYHSKRSIGRGYVTEVLNKVFQDENIEVIFRAMNAKKARRLVKRGRYSMMLATEEDSANENLILSSKPIGDEAKSFYGRVDLDWKFSGTSSLKQITLGLIEDEDYSEIAEYVEENKDLKLRLNYTNGKDAVKTLLRKLAKGEIDVALINRYVAGYYIETMGVASNIVELSGSVANTPSKAKYISFSAKNTKADIYAKIFDERIDEMRESGELSSIMAKYGTGERTK